MIYARAHDQNVADDYFAAMERVEQRLEIVPPEVEETIEVVKVQENPSTRSGQVFQLIEQLKRPELCFEERLGIVADLRKALYDKENHPFSMKERIECHFSPIKNHILSP